jgi:ESX secretion system protein EccE
VTTVVGRARVPARTPDPPRRIGPPPRPLRIGTHRLTTAGATRIALPGTSGGVLLGYDGGSRPVQVPLFRAEPTRAVLVGGLWAARLVVFRALATGARVVASTRAPKEWQGFGRWATGRDDRLAMVPADRPVTVAADAATPALLLSDAGRPIPGPWRTQLTVLPQLTPAGLPPADLVLLQRLAGPEVPVAAALGLPAAHLAALHPDMLAVLDGRSDRYLWLRPTEIELRQFGAPRR